MTYLVCSCGHAQEGHIQFGCLLCSCIAWEPELRVISQAVPFDWARDGDL